MWQDIPLNVLPLNEDKVETSALSLFLSFDLSFCL